MLFISNPQETDIASSQADQQHSQQVSSEEPLTTSGPTASFSRKEPLMRGSAKSQQRWEAGGRPLAVALHFHAWLLSDEKNLPVGRALSTKESWPNWEQMSVEQRREIALQLRHWSISVCYPAEGMAYVFSPLLHSHYDALSRWSWRETYEAYWITLVHQDDEWRIESIDLRQPTQA
jgi:hypothetical protein